ncbi:Sec-independent protein translocase protein TatB homolog [Gordonia hirsuta DSM 44140 = NBRC 16056]|uniref:Sec-independent protein translocase protein TatB n=1 Tax=Gordonia hirsuta DSM 44140 = NBRC 16056 TaxID=1121927 RepID=L7L9P9_9ACTN|nr:Sec-independent protein translocase protein TatB [Gordonia hirsuta]GAC56763.1 Sec-independent protein translocase protein TatB homolog [Gordonia hirsuta DSM 44140 = NBRC 16056]
MFSSVGWGEILVLIVLALIILGPERLPDAITWVMQSLRKVRDYATGASKDLQEQMGTDFDSLREPLQQLNELRQMSPRAMVTKHLFDGDSSTLDEIETSVRDSLSISGPAPSNPHPPGGATPGSQPPIGPGTQVDLTRLAGTDQETAAPPAEPTPKPRRLDAADWDAT